MRYGNPAWGAKRRVCDGGDAACGASNVAKERFHATSYWCLLAALQAAHEDDAAFPADNVYVLREEINGV